MREKLAGYALDPAHKDGGPKAKGFATILGITLSDIDYLENTIRTAILQAPVSNVYIRARYGAQCEVKFPIAGLGAKSDRTVQVITGWEYADPGGPPRMTTAYLKPEKHHNRQPEA